MKLKYMIRSALLKYLGVDKAISALNKKQAILVKKQENNTIDPMAIADLAIQIGKLMNAQWGPHASNHWYQEFEKNYIEKHENN